MLMLLLIATAFNNAFSIPVTTSVDALNPLPPVSILGRDIPIPECVNPARYRTMQQIILSCFATVFACTWVSLHPNVSDPRNSGWQNFAMRIRTMFWALIGPEFITVWALRQRMAAAEHAKAYNQRFELTTQPRSMFQLIKNWFCRPQKGRMPGRAWTLTHGFLLEMHGLVFVTDGQSPPSSRSEKQKWNKLAEELDRAGKTEQAKQAKAFVNIGRLLGSAPPKVLYNIYQLFNCFDISEDDINDKSKGDFFTKFIVVTQTSWFIIQCITRWIQRLHVTELEIATLAFAILNIITYILWWNKPQNMRVAIPILEKCEACRAAVERGDKADCEDAVESYPYAEQASFEGQNHTLEEYRSFLEKEQNIYDYGTSIPCAPLLSRLTAVFDHAIQGLFHINPFSAYFAMIGDTPPCVSSAFYSSTKGTAERAVAISVGLIGLLFGGVHLLPIWLSTFSTRDKSLWIGSTICVFIEPVFVSLVLPVLLRLWMFLHLPSISSLILYFPHTVGFLFYVIARVILIVLAFTSLRSLPPGAFANIEWSTFFPHL